MSLLKSYQAELFSSIENRDLTTFRKIFLEFDYYVLSLRPETSDRKYMKDCFETYQELYIAVLLHGLTDFYKILLKSQNNVLNMAHKIEQNMVFKTIHHNIDSIFQFYNQPILNAFLEHLQTLEKEHKINLVILALAYLFSKDTDKLPDNLLEQVLLKFPMPFAHYHFMLKIVLDFNGDDFFQHEDVISKMILAFKRIDSKKADEVICTIGQLAIDRESINLFKAIEVALDNSNIQSKSSKFTSGLLKQYLNNFNIKNGNLKGIVFLNKTLKNGDKLNSIED